MRNDDRRGTFWSLQKLQIGHNLCTFDSILHRRSSKFQATFLNVFENLFEQLVKRGWDIIDVLREKNNFIKLLRNIWIKIHFPL